MEVKIERSFLKDLSKVRDKNTADDIKRILLKLEQVSSFKQISNLKKLKGHPSAFRIKTGNYRMGIFIEGKTIEVVRFLHRKDVYRYFP